MTDNAPPAATVGVTSHSGFKLNDQQQEAFDLMVKWLDPEADLAASPYFVLEGFAGTGKTFTCKALVSAIKGRVCFTAPTNKAVKVLRATLTNDSYRPECATIYSLLGLMMVANGEVKELKGRDKDDEEKLDLGNYRLVVVDEGSMLNSIVMAHIREAQAQYGVRFLFMGDPAQLPPVKELASPIWKLTGGHAKLTKVERHDNQILTLVTQIRKVVDHPAPNIKLMDDNDGAQGVWVMSNADFRRAIVRRADRGDFSEQTLAKVIAWRNVKVDEYNDLIRQVLYRDGYPDGVPKFVATDRVIFTGPAQDLDDQPMAKTDDEGTVTSVHVVSHPVYSDFKCFRLGITLDTNRLVTAFTLHPAEQGKFDRESESLATTARSNGRAWRDFWAFKEAFHGIRHAYAITAHRAQGSTYTAAFVDYRDILINRNRQEAYRCLYVACSRPTTELYLG